MQQRLEHYLLSKNILSKTVLNKILAEIATYKQPIGLLTLLSRKELVNPELLCQIASELFHIPVIDLHPYFTQSELIKLSQQKTVIDLLSINKLITWQLLPLHQSGKTLEIIIADPIGLEHSDEIFLCTQLRPHFKLAREDQLNILLSRLKTYLEIHDFNINNKNSVDHTLYSEIIATHSETPVVRFLDLLLKEAIEKSATDIHFECYREHFRIRFRIDGVLHELHRPPKQIAELLISRIKILANLDITEKRRPQDGRWRTEQFDLRVSSCPTLYGEKIVLRLLQQQKLLILAELGFLEEQRNIFTQAINKSQGLILVTGPTGSGKTMSLYSALSHLNYPHLNICTVEDPIEIDLPNINQIAVNYKAKLDFATILRSLLRQDPDIIMIGEIRDGETARIALHAAETGHLVFSTLHTKNTHEAITRLEHLGVSRYEILSQLTLINAQRLVRKLCLYCREENNLNNLDISSELFKKFNINKIYTPKIGGCKNCLDGYHGRIAFHEMLPLINNNINNNLDNLNNFDTIKVGTLLSTGIDLVKNGITSLSEIERCV